MPIPEPFTVAALGAGVLTNLASDILKHRAQALEDTLAGRMLKWAGLIEPGFNDRLQDAIAHALELYFETYPQYQLSGVMSFFGDPAAGNLIGSYILDRQPLNENDVRQALEAHFGGDPISVLYMRQKGLDPQRIIPDFLECYRKVLNQQLSVPQIAIMLKIVEQTDTVIAEIQASEERMKGVVQQAIQRIEQQDETLDQIAGGIETIKQRTELFDMPYGPDGSNKQSNDSAQSEIPSVSTQDVWIVLIQDVLVPIDVDVALEATKPSKAFGDPVFIRPDLSSWADAAEYQRNLVADLLKKSRHFLPPRFAVFSVAPIPLIMQLGFLLSDSVRVRYFKLHVDDQSWQWPTEEEYQVDHEIHVDGLPIEPILHPIEVVLRVSLSATVGRNETEVIVPNAPLQIDISVERPDLMWIRSPLQLSSIVSVVRKVLTEIRSEVPNCESIHLFSAVPAPCALAIGQQINPRMNPPVHIYEYSRQKTPRYEYALTLKHN